MVGIWIQKKLKHFFKYAWGMDKQRFLKDMGFFWNIFLLLLLLFILSFTTAFKKIFLNLLLKNVVGDCHRLLVMIEIVGDC